MDRWEKNDRASPLPERALQSRGRPIRSSCFSVCSFLLCPSFAYWGAVGHRVLHPSLLQLHDGKQGGVQPSALTCLSVTVCLVSQSHSIVCHP